MGQIVPVVRISMKHSMVFKSLVSRHTRVRIIRGPMIGTKRLIESSISDLSDSFRTSCGTKDPSDKNSEPHMRAVSNL